MPIKPYLTDVSDEQWSFAAPYLVLMTQDAPQREHSLREVFNALRWIVRAGSPWRLLPNDFAPCEAVYQQSRRWLGGQLLRGPNLNATETGRLGSQRNMTNSDDLLQPHPRYAIDANRMYDLRSTARIVELLAVRNEDRSDGWTQALMEAAWNGSIEIPHTPFFEGPDGFTYLRLDVPRPGLPFESNCLARQAKMLLSTVRGAALFSGPEATEPAYIFPVGMIDAMVRFDSHQGDPIDLAEIMAAPHMSFGGEIRPSSESLVGSPSRDFLPPHTAKGFHWHLVNGWGIAAPRVALIVLKNAAPSRNLVIDRTIDEIPGNARHAEAVVRMFLWYLPPRRSILLRPPSLAIGDMTLLSDYFE